VARRGYVNLLQPQDKRSPHPGDSADAVRARARLRAGRVEREFVERIAGLVEAGVGDAVVDVGCGDAVHVAAVVTRTGCEGHGLDISLPAIERAAKLHPRLSLIVGNADRTLPYAAASFRAVLSVTARLNPAEFRRVTREDGMLVVIVPGPEDLIELRTAVLGERIERDRARRVIEASAPLYTLAHREQLNGRERLDADAIADVLTASYRGLRRSRRVRTASLGAMEVTLARDVLVFRPTPGRRLPVAPSRDSP